MTTAVALVVERAEMMDTSLVVEMVVHSGASTAETTAVALVVTTAVALVVD